MIMKVLTLALNLFLARAQAPAENPGFFSKITAKTVRKAIMMLAGFVLGAFLFIGGFFTVLMDLILATQNAQTLALSYASIVGFGLILLSTVTFAILFSRKTWEIPAPHHQASTNAPQSNPIQDAVAELIRDFTEERKLVRAMQFEQAGTANMTEADLTTGPTVGSETYPSADRSAYN